MFLSMTHGGGDASSEETHVGECVHNSCDLKSMMKEIRIADAYNQKRNSKHKHLLHLGGNSMVNFLKLLLKSVRYIKILYFS